MVKCNMSSMDLVSDKQFDVSVLSDRHVYLVKRKQDELISVDSNAKNCEK